MERLVWTSWAKDELREVVDALAIINPKGWTAAQIMAHVERSFRDEGLRSYCGTAGWYVAVYPASGEEGVWHAKATLAAFGVLRHLKG